MVAESAAILSRMRAVVACRQWSPFPTWVGSLLLCLVLAACRSGTPPRAISPEIAAANNHAVGLMGQFDFDGAVKAFEAVGTSAPDWPGVRLNLAIALMNRQGPEDTARAEALFRELITMPDVAARARYALGVLLVHEGREEEAQKLLRAVAEGNPPDAFAAYFLGQLALTASPADALAWYRRAAAREPLLRSAYYGAFLALRRLGQDGEAGTMLERFQALERNPQAKVAEFKYTRMGPLSEVITVDATGASAAAVPSGPRFESQAPLVADRTVNWRNTGPARSITVADIDGDGALDLFIAGAIEGRTPNAVLLRRGQGFVLDASHPLAAVTEVRAALWGDLDDDGYVDVVLCRPAGGTEVWQQAAAGRWRNATAATAIRLPRTGIVDGAMFDADHDGDLDIWLISGSGPNELLNNDGNFRFRAIGAQAGIAGDGRPSRGLAIADLDGDRDADVIVVKAAPPHDVFINDRGWVYHRDDQAVALASEPITSLIAGDADADGEIELYSSGGAGLRQWRRQRDGRWRATAIDEAVETGPPLAWADTDGDGGLELIASRGAGWGAYAPSTKPSSWQLMGDAAGGAAPGGWAVAHLDAAAGPSVVGIDAQGQPVVWRPGPGRFASIGLALSGRDPASDQRRSNVSGIGTRVAVRADSKWTAFDTTRLASGPGQSAQPMTIGLAGLPRADFVAMVWPDGVLQTELALDAGRLHAIGETQRQLSSCPVLFVWNGERFDFVTDVLGTGGIGFFERPGVAAAPFPREHVLLPASLRAVDGLYGLKLAEPMEEITYLDRASLVAYDLPPGWHLALDERKAVEGPAPTGAPVFYREERLATRATDDTGRDVRELVARPDGRAVGPLEISPRFIGLSRAYGLSLEFDRPIAEGAGRPTLLVDGWIEYPYSQTVFAAWQAGAVYQAPTLEVRDSSGRWHVVASQFGYPAGMPRQMSFPLPVLPPGAKALRLRTSQEIYWDRIAIVYGEPAPVTMRRMVLPLRSAVLGSAGFARRTLGAQRRPHFDDTAAAPLADTRHPRGWYSEFGAVGPLVADADDAVAIFGPGEEIAMRFEAPASAPPDGWTRWLVLELGGWCKDMDLYTENGETVAPLPGADTPARRQLHARFNTRYAAGY
jgi:hypothetical protein